MEWSQTESVWNDYERLLLDALTEWESNLHSCGLQLTDSLSRRLEGIPDPKLGVVYQECLGCKALDDFWASKAEMLKKAHEEHRNPETYMLPRVLPWSEIEELAKRKR